MNEKQPYEKHLADKLESLPPPGSSGKNWPAMKALLDQQMPKAGGGRGASWWMYGIIIGVLVIGTLLITNQTKTDPSQLAQDVVAPSSEVSKTSPNKENSQAASGVSVKKETVNSGAIEKSQPATKTDEELTKESNSNTISNTNTDNQLNDKNSTLTNKASNKPANPLAEKSTIKKSPSLNGKESVVTTGSGIEGKESSASNKKNKKPVVENQSLKYNGLTVESESNAVNEKKVDKKSISIKSKRFDEFSATTETDIKKSLVKEAKSSKSKTTLQNRNTESINTAIDEEDKLQATVIFPGDRSNLQSERNFRFLQPDSIASDYAKLVKPTAVFAKSRFKETTERTKALKNRVVGTGEDKNFVIGLTLPLSMPLSDQRVLSYNVNAGINTISDYIPSPNLQYHFNQTSYIQAEIQIANPQFIQPVLLSQSKYELSGQQGSYRFVNKSVFAKKLYYFNLPIGINYSPFKNFYLGTGLQFSSLMSGIGFSETRGFNSLGPSARDTLFNASYFKFRSDTLSGRLNSNEFRLTLDANYYWKKFTLGMRYNQALNNYVSIQVNPNTPVFTDRNKALQIYLRYNLWEDRKKKKTNSMARR